MHKAYIPYSIWSNLQYGYGGSLLSTIALWIQMIIWVPMEQLSWWLIFARYWLYYYDFKLKSFNCNKDWRMAIDPIHESTDWYVKNVKRFGNQRIVLIILIIISYLQQCINCLIAFTVWQFAFSRNKDIAWATFNVVRIINAFIPIIFVVYLIVRFKKDSINILKDSKDSIDSLGIYSELYGVIIWGIIYALLGFGWCIAIVSTLNTDDLAIEKSIGMIWQYCWTFCLMAYLYLIIIYPKILFNKLTKSKSKYKFDSIMEFAAILKKEKGDTFGNHLKIKPLLQVQNENDNPQNWKQLISNAYGYQLFVKHLENEFSLENLLFIQEVSVEFVQVLIFV